MRLLEILTEEPSEVVSLAQDGQRDRLMAEASTYQQLDFRGVSARDRARMLEGVTRTPSHILLRGFRPFYSTARTFPRARLVVDFCGRVDVPEDLPGRFFLGRARALCYSEKAEEILKARGISDVTCTPGPLLPDLREGPVEDSRLVVGVISGEDSVQALRDLLAVREKQEWRDVDIVAPHQFRGVDRVDSDMDVVECADVLIGALEREDLGEPCDAAILAAAYGRGLVAVTTSAAEKLGYTGNRYARVAKYTKGGYGAGVRLYMEHRATMAQGAPYPRPDLTVETLLRLLRE